MADGDLDRELARRFEELRRADDLRTPPFRGVLERAPRPGRSIRRRPALFLAGAAAAVLLAAVLLRPARGPAGAPAAASAGAIAEWKSPTDSLLETPGNELYGEIPSTAPQIPDWALGPERSPGAAAPSTPARKGASS